MLSVFLMQLAGGCMLCIGLTRIDDMSWRYLRLMAIVSVAVLLFNAILQVVLTGVLSGGMSVVGGFLDPGLYLAFVWLVISSRQRERITGSQRVTAGAAGVAAILNALPLLMTASGSVASRRLGFPDLVSGALLIGSATSAMLLGHRYLTDTGMTIAPLRRLTRIFLAAVFIRAIWVIAVSIAQRATLGSGGMAATWNLMMLGVRFGVGIVGTAVFAYMVWDCVKRRSTQSATGILYLTMVFVFIGELTGQYLMRTSGLPV